MWAWPFAHRSARAACRQSSRLEPAHRPRTPSAGHGLDGAKRPSSPRPAPTPTDRLAILQYPIRLLENHTFYCITFLRRQTHSSSSLLLITVIAQFACCSLVTFLPLYQLRHGFDHVRKYSDPIRTTRADQADFLEQQCTSHRRAAPGSLESCRLVPTQSCIHRIGGIPDTTIATHDVNHDALPSMDINLVHALPTNTR